MSSKTAWDNTGNADMKQGSYITLELDREQLDIVVRAFDEVLKNPDDIDFSMGSFSPLPNLQGLNNQFKTFQNGDDAVKIPLNLDDWATFFPYLDHSRTAVFDIDDAEVLDELFEKYLEIDERGIAPAP